MRRTLIIVTSLILMCSLNSCVREYYCQCHISFSGATNLPDTTMNEYIIKDTKDNAEKLCEGASTSSSDPITGIKTTERCSLF